MSHNQKREVPSSPYQVFERMYIDNYRKTYPQYSLKDVRFLLVQKWNKLSKSQKSLYIKAAKGNLLVNKNEKLLLL